MDVKRVHHHKDHAHQGAEEDVDRDLDKLFDVGANLLQLAQRLAAALVFKDLIRQAQRMANAIRVHLRAHLLRDQTDHVVLDVFGHSRNKGHAHRRAQQQRDAAKELLGGILLKLRRVVIDHVAKNQGIEEGEDLVNRGE